MDSKKFIERKRNQYNAIGIKAIAFGKRGFAGNVEITDLLDEYAKEYAAKELEKIKEDIFEGKEGMHFADSKQFDDAIAALRGEKGEG